MLTQRPHRDRSGLPFVLHARVSDPTFRALAVVGEARGIPVSEVVREFVDDGLSRFVNRDGQSLLDVVRDDASIGSDAAVDQERTEQLAAEIAAVA